MALKTGDICQMEGFVQFDPQEREAGSQTVLNVTIRNKANDLVSLTFWPGTKEDPRVKAIAVGDYVTARGKYSERTVQKADGTQQTYKGVSIFQAAISPGVAEAPRHKAASEDDSWA